MAVAWDDVRNIGPASVLMLEEIGIASPEALSDVGPVEAYVRLRRAFPGRVTRTMLWALAGADVDLDWRELPQTLKAGLLEAVEKADGHAGAP